MADSVVKNANKDESLTARSSYSPIDEMFSDDIPFNPEMDDKGYIISTENLPYSTYNLDRGAEESGTEDLRERLYENLTPEQSTIQGIPGLTYPGRVFGQDITNFDYKKPKEMPFMGESTRALGIANGGNVGIETLKKTTIEIQETPADRNTTVLKRMIKQSGAPAQDPKLLAQVSQILGRDV